MCVCRGVEFSLSCVLAVRSPRLGAARWPVHAAVTPWPTDRTRKRDTATPAATSTDTRPPPTAVAPDRRVGGRRQLYTRTHTRTYSHLFCIHKVRTPSRSSISKQSAPPFHRRLPDSAAPPHTLLSPAHSHTHTHPIRSHTYTSTKRTRPTWRGAAPVLACRLLTAMTPARRHQQPRHSRSTPRSYGLRQGAWSCPEANRSACAPPRGPFARAACRSARSPRPHSRTLPTWM